MFLNSRKFCPILYTFLHISWRSPYKEFPSDLNNIHVQCDHLVLVIKSPVISKVSVIHCISNIQSVCVCEDELCVGGLGVCVCVVWVCRHVCVSMFVCGVHDVCVCMRVGMCVVRVFVCGVQMWVFVWVCGCVRVWMWCVHVVCVCGGGGGGGVYNSPIQLQVALSQAVYTGQVHWGCVHH